MTARISLALFVITALLYGQVMQHDFINFDTHKYLLLNPHIQDGLNLNSLTWAFTTFYFSNWHPMTWVSYLLEVEIFGLSPEAFHLTNLLLHAGNSVLLFLFLNASTGRLWPSALAALLFAIHPAQVESVAWVAERKDVLSLFFMLGCLLCFHRYVSSGSKVSYCAALALYVFGLMSKPMILTLPFVLLLFDYWPYNRLQQSGIARLLVEKVPFFIATVASAILTLLAQKEGGAIVTADALGFVDRSVNALVAYGYYLKTALLPADLAVFYPHPTSWPLATVVGAVAALVFVSGLAIWSAIRAPWAIVGWLFFLGTLVPVIGLVQVGAQAYADRYTYLPYIGLFILLAFSAGILIERFPQYSRYAKTAIVLLCLTFAVSTFQYMSHWKNSITIWTHTLYVTDPKFRALVTSADETDGSQRPAGLFKAYYSLASARMDIEHYAEAEWLFREAVQLVPSSIQTRFYHGVALSEIGRVDEAKAVFSGVLREQPDNQLLRNEIEKQLAKVATQLSSDQ